VPKRHEQQRLERLARDLFRHLDDAKQLQRNPLVSAYFASQESGGVSEDEALAEIRLTLVSAARSRYRADVPQGQRRADRSFAIITGLCQGRSAKQIASDLRISLPQFYRDRRNAIVGTVGALIERRERFSVVNAQEDVFKLRVVRIGTLIDQGFAARAMIEAQTLLREIATKQEVIPVLCELSRAAYEFGSLARAKDHCASAREKLEQDQAERQLTDMLEARIRLVEFYVSCMEDDPIISYERICALAADLGLDRRALDGDFAVQVLLNTCRSAVLVGKIAHAREALDLASNITLELRLRPTLQSKVDFMRAYAANAAGPTLEPLESLTTALRSAQSAGSAQGMLFAAFGLADYFVSQGREQDARRHSEIAYRVACATEGEYLIACTIDAVAAILLRTSQWRYAEELLRSHPLPTAPYYAMRNACFQAQLFLRRGESYAAAGMFVEAAHEAERLHQFRSLAMILPDLAVAEMKCGYRGRALARAREARDVVQRFGSASMRRLGRERLADLLTAG